MGSRMAPSYANMFMGKLENDLLQRAERKAIVWWKYIDDVFAIWTHGEENLLKFIHDMNFYHATIKFTAEWSRESVVFQDTIYKVIREGYKLITDLYTKPTDTHQYLHQRSCHPAHCKHSIVYSQALRLRRICSQDMDYQRHTEELKMYLVNRGYDGERIQPEIHTATGIDRETLLISCKKRQEEGYSFGTCSRFPS